MKPVPTSDLQSWRLMFKARRTSRRWSRTSAGPGSGSRRPALSIGRRRSRDGFRLAREEVDDLAQRSQLPQLIRGHDGGLWKDLLKGGQDLDSLDGIDAEVGVEVHGDIEHIHWVACFFSDDAQENRRDVFRASGPVRRIRDDTIRG